jgi:hypothetical protein
MADAPKCKQFLIGLPGAGKTTYLAALWHVVSSSEITGSMQLVRMHGDQAHLNHISQLWADTQELLRTTVAAEQYTSMILTDPMKGDSTEIVFPDLSGESFRSQWTDRQISAEQAELLQQAAGGLFLVHPETISEPHLITNIAPIVEGLRPSPDSVGAPPSSRGEADTGCLTTPEWDPEDAPTQTQLVDLLQFVASLNTKRPIRIAVIISAWDLVKERESPEKWLRKRLPLLWQYLASNTESFAAAFYGVSAQGGSLAEAGELQKKQHPSDRIRVVENDLSESHDITLPVKWVMG